MEPKGSLPPLQVSVTCPYPEPDQSSDETCYTYINPIIRVKLDALQDNGIPWWPLIEALYVLTSHDTSTFSYSVIASHCVCAIGRDMHFHPIIYVLLGVLSHTCIRYE